MVFCGGNFEMTSHMDPPRVKFKRKSAKGKTQSRERESVISEGLVGTFGASESVQPSARKSRWARYASLGNNVESQEAPNEVGKVPALLETSELSNAVIPEFEALVSDSEPQPVVVDEAMLTSSEPSQGAWRVLENNTFSIGKRHFGDLHDDNLPSITSEYGEDVTEIGGWQDQPALNRDDDANGEDFSDVVENLPEGDFSEKYNMEIESLDHGSQDGGSREPPPLWTVDETIKHIQEMLGNLQSKLGDSESRLNSARVALQSEKLAERRIIDAMLAL